MRRAFFVTAVLVEWAHLAAAQTNDHLYRSWSWAPAAGAPRSAGLAGAFVAVADDASSAELNPAGMLLLPRSEIAASFYTLPSATVGIGDRRDRVSGIGFLGGTGRLGARIAIGGYLIQPHKEILQLQAIDLPDRAVYSGSLESSITEGGVAAAYSLSRRLHVGGRLTATHLKLEGAYRRTRSAVLPDLESGTAAGHTRITGSFGLLYGTIDDRVRLGLAVRAGASYSVSRTANQFPGGGIDAGSEYELRQPASVAVGAAVQASPRLLVTGQLDFVRYSEIRPFLRPGTVSEGTYRTDDGLEPALAAELSWPLGTWSIQARGGVRSRAPGGLSYEGPDPSEAVAFQGAGRVTLVSAGASLVQRSGFGLDLAAVFGGESPELVAGARMRF